CWKWSHLIAAVCSDDQKRRFLKPFLEDDTFLLGKGISEPSAGSDNRLPPDDPKAGLKLRAERHGDEWILNGEKCFIANASVGKLFFIDARTDPNAPLKQGTTMFLVPRDTPGFRIGKVFNKSGWRFYQNGEMIFENARVPHANVVGPVNGSDMKTQQAGDRTGGDLFGDLELAANALGVCDDACGMALALARTKKQGGRVLFEQQPVQLKLNRMHLLTEALRSFVMRVAWEHDHKVHSANAGLAMNFSTDVIQEVTELNLDLHAGAGVFDRRADKLVRDAIIWSHLAGDSVQRMKATRRLARQVARSPPQHGEPVAEHEVVAGDDAALERDALPLAPHLGADGVAGKDRPREPRLDAFELLRPVIGVLPQDRARRDAEACRAMQDGTLEAGVLGALGIGVERILVAVEAVQQREIGRRGQIADLLPRRLGPPVRHRRLRRLPAETAVFARKRAAVDGGDRRPVLADQVARSLDDGGVAGALVDDLLHARPAHEARLRRKRPMQHHLEVAGDDEALVDAEGRIGHAARPPQHHRHGGKGGEPGALVHEFELARIERVHADADAERIEGALALTVAHADVARPVGHDPCVIEIRFHQCRLPCSQFATLRPGRERFRAQAPCASLPPDPR